MVHSRKYDYYAFPGGGIDPGEKKEETLIREIREELGLEVIPESVREYGLVIRKLKDESWAKNLYEREALMIGKLREEGFLES